MTLILYFAVSPFATCDRFSQITSHLLLILASNWTVRVKESNGYNAIYYFSVAPSQKDAPVALMPLIPGLLVAEPYSWKSLIVGNPILRIRTTSTKAAALTLPPG